MDGWARHVIDAVGAPKTDPAGYLHVFYTPSAESRRAGQQSLGRMIARNDDRDTATNWQTRMAQYDAVCDWGVPDTSRLQRLTAIEMPSSSPTATATP